MAVPAQFRHTWAQRLFEGVAAGFPVLCLVCAWSGPANGQFTGGGGQTGITLDVADWVPARDPDYGGWGVVQAGAPADDPLEWTNEAGTLSLPPGSYDVYWVQGYDQRNDPLLLAAGVTVEAGSTATLAADSGLILEVGDWVPSRDPDYGWWGAVAADDPPDALVHWTRQAAALLLPEGVYDVYWVQSYATRGSPLLIAEDVVVVAGAATAVAADSGVALAVADWVPARHADYGWWGAVAAGDPPDPLVHWTTEADALLLPPGSYDIYWVQDYDNRNNPLRIASGVAVEAGAVAVVRADSGIVIEVGDWVPQRDADYGWWGAVAAGGSPDVLAHWTREHEALLLPPGRYSVFWNQDYNNRNNPLLLASSVDVDAGATTVVSADSGVALDIAPWVPARSAEHGWWGATVAGGPPDEPVQWTRQAEAMLLPPGHYDIYWVQDYEHRNHPLLLAAGLEVKSEGFVGVGVAIRVETVPPWLMVAEWGAEPNPEAFAREVVTVIQVQPGGPAAQAGIAAGDVIVAIEGEPVAGLSLDEVVTRMRGAIGADVMLTLMREGAEQPIKATVTRGMVSPVEFVDVSSGIRANVTAGARSLDPEEGWWGAVPAGGAPADRVNWSTGSAIHPLLVAPGVYDVYWRPGPAAEPQLQASEVAVGAGQVMLVTIGDALAEPDRGFALADLPDAPFDASVFSAFGVGSAEAPEAGITLPEGVQQVQARYDWRDAEIGLPLGVRWFKEGELVLEEGEEAAAPRGTTTWILRMESGEALPNGNYRVEAVNDGKPGPSLRFTVGALESFFDLFGAPE